MASHKPSITKDSASKSKSTWNKILDRSLRARMYDLRTDSEIKNDPPRSLAAKMYDLRMYNFGKPKKETIPKTPKNPGTKSNLPKSSKSGMYMTSDFMAYGLEESA